MAATPFPNICNFFCSLSGSLFPSWFRSRQRFKVNLS